MNFNIRQWLPKSWIYYCEIATIIIPSLFPLFFSLPYRVNIFLSWEGAYRLYLGQIPYEDFGLPMGFGFWIIPAIFFNFFGPFLFTLVKAQVFINIISLFAFRNILKILDVEVGKRTLSLVIFVLSYSFFNFWPWYNHTVYVYHLLSLNFVLLAIFSLGRKNLLYIILAGFFSFLAFFTKQDSGALTIVFGLFLLIYNAISQSKYNLLTVYSISVVTFALIFIVPFIPDDFFYWFNLGQAPHDSRVNLWSFIHKIFSGSFWEKFYVFLIVFIVLGSFPLANVLTERKKYLFLLITLGTIVQALIIKVTSPLPTDHHNYYHAFATAFIICHIPTKINFARLRYFVPFVALIFFWWSSLYWDYANRIFKTKLPTEGTNFSEIQAQWVLSDLKAFEHISMPEATIEGMKNILGLEALKGRDDLKVLNMSELTPLAYELGYTPPTEQPLWYHLNIGMFTEQQDAFVERIRKQEYDLVLFQVIPDLDNFFPYGVQEELKENKNYELIDTFEGPRKRSEGYSYIEVYIKREIRNND